MLLKQSFDGVEILSVDEKELNKTLEEISNKIKKDHPDVSEVILFGSFSKGAFTPRSDLDIAIVVERSEKTFIQRSDDYWDYFLDLPFDINLGVYTTHEKEKMLKEGNQFIREVLKGKNLLK